MENDGLMGLSWMEEKVEKLPSNNFLYKVICFFTFKKKLTYKELYAMLCSINRARLGDEDAKKFALVRILATYKFNNNVFPNITRDNG